MGKLLNIAKTLRNHWKKSTVGFLALTYGLSYGYEKYRTNQLMRMYCEEAKKFGEQCTAPLQKMRHVTVILNPVAHKRKAKSLFERYAVPILHLAGIKVSLITTESEGQARELMSIMGNTDAVVIAGGNGTLHEAITGLLRRPEFEDNDNSAMPVGILPVGNSNYIARALFPPWSISEAKWLAEAAMAVVKETTKAIDVIKIEGIDEKPLYALSSVELGDLVQVETSLPKYWYFGPLRDKFIYLYNSFKRHLVIDDVKLEFTPPCEGCSKCHMKVLKRRSGDSSRWWAAFMPKVNTIDKPYTVDYSKIINEDCGTFIEKHSSFSNLVIATSLRNFCTIPDPSSKAFWMNICPDKLNLKNYFKLGLAYHRGCDFQTSEIITSISANKAKLLSNESAKNCYIDTEPYDFQSMTLSLLPKHLVVYG